MSVKESSKLIQVKEIRSKGSGNVKNLEVAQQPVYLEQLE